MEEKLIKIFIIDDHKIVRDGLRSLIIPCRNIRIVGETSTGKGLLVLLEKELPDVVILDLVLPDISGLDLIKIISEKYPCIKILILTAEMDEDIIMTTIKNGASGFLNKDVSAKEFIKAVQLVAEGESYFGQRISGIIYKSYINKVQNYNEKNSKCPALSERETEIVLLLSEGLTFKDIAAKLFISPRTVENHKTNILEKLGLKNTIELVRYAIKENILKL
jgi:DNA-binding NarL/FixJ family response regulator